MLTEAKHLQNSNAEVTNELCGENEAVTGIRMRLPESSP